VRRLIGKLNLSIVYF